LELQRAENNTISSNKQIHKFYPPFSQIRRRKRKEKKIDVEKTEKKKEKRIMNKIKFKESENIIKPSLLNSNLFQEITKSSLKDRTTKLKEKRENFREAPEIKKINTHTLTKRKFIPERGR
jgi:hypothetical protein